MVFPVVMQRCDNWSIKKAECRRTDAFKLWCWRRLERTLDSKEIKQVNPKGNQPWMFHYFQQWKPIFIGMTVAEVEAPILSPLDAKSWLTGKDPDAGQDWGQEERRQQRMRQWDGITDSKDVNLNKLQETVKDWCAIVHGVIKSWTQLSNWKTTTTMPNYVNIPSCAYILPLYLQKWSVCINHLSI